MRSVPGLKTGLCMCRVIQMFSIPVLLDIFSQNYIYSRWWITFVVENSYFIFCCAVWYSYSVCQTGCVSVSVCLLVCWLD